MSETLSVTEMIPNKFDLKSSSENDNQTSPRVAVERDVN